MEVKDGGKEYLEVVVCGQANILMMISINPLLRRNRWIKLCLN